MTDPLRRLKFLPWRSLIQVSALITIIVIVLEFLIALGYTQSPIVGSVLNILYRPPLGLLLPLITAFGIGALAVYLVERLYQQVSINTGCLWALILCLALLLTLKSLLPLPAIVVKFDQIQLVGMIVGVFWKGRPYWR